MQIIAVKNKKGMRDFLETPAYILGDDPNYIRVLDNDTLKIFSDQNNLMKRGGKYQLWVVKSDEGNLIGRIAAFVNPKYKNKIKAGGVGFFDSVHDQAVCDLLLDTAKEWLKAEGMEAMDGPINFGERDRFWGMMVEGFMPPVYGMHYAKPYYQELFENYGFRLYYNQLCYGMPTTNDVPVKFVNKYESIKDDPKYSVEHVDKKNLKKYAKDFTAIYNAAWAKHGGGKSMHQRQALKVFESMKPIMDPKLTIFVYYDGEPVGMWLNIPDINAIMRRFDGRFGLIEKLRFFVALRQKVAHRAVGIVFGVVPSHQGKGIDAMLIIEGAKTLKAKNSPYDYFEMQWVGDFNPKMVNVVTALEGDLTRRLVTYRYLFDRGAPFERHPMI